MTESKDLWLRTGYEIFALNGKNGLKIDTLSRKVGINKSSFYHHFADIEVFISHLMKLHIQQSFILADKEKKAKNIDPELIEILIQHKYDLLFNRQLRIGRNDKTYADTLTTANQIAGNAFVELWAKDLKLQLTPNQLNGLFELALDNFYLQITFENLTKSWLTEYFLNLKRIAKKFS
ncbi:MAG: TetR/AcrR family transcriptional regulator [Saprospiraceae bacterium]